MRMAMIAITTSSSIKVKPRRHRRRSLTISMRGNPRPRVRASGPRDEYGNESNGRRGGCQEDEKKITVPSSGKAPAGLDAGGPSQQGSPSPHAESGRETTLGAGSGVIGV